jgi:hypothetical protein
LGFYLEITNKISAQHTFTHPLYILPKQLFPLRLGYHWFVKTGAQLNFTSEQLVLSNALINPLFMNHVSFMPTINTQMTIPPPLTQLNDILALLQQLTTLFQKSVQTNQITFLTWHVINNVEYVAPVHMATR